MYLIFYNFLCVYLKNIPRVTNVNKFIGVIYNTTPLIQVKNHLIQAVFYLFRKYKHLNI